MSTTLFLSVCTDGTALDLTEHNGTTDTFITIIDGIATFSHPQKTSLNAGIRIEYGTDNIAKIASISAEGAISLVTISGVRSSDITNALVTKIAYDYSSLNAAINDIDVVVGTLNLVSISKKVGIYCYAPTVSGTLDSTNVVVTGSPYITNSTYDIKVIVPTTSRHSGFLIPAASASTLFNFTCYKYSGNINISGIPNITITGILFTNFYVETTDAVQGTLKIEKCNIVDQTTIASLLSTADYKLLFSNNLVNLEFNNALIFDLSDAVTNPVIKVYNNTFRIKANSVQVTNYANTSFKFKNNLVYVLDGYTATLASPPNTIDAQYNSYSYNKTSPGTGESVSQDFTFFDEVGNNFRIDSTDEGAKYKGTDLSGDSDLPITDDIRGVSVTPNYVNVGAFAVDWVNISPSFDFKVHVVKNILASFDFKVIVVAHVLGLFDFKVKVQNSSTFYFDFKVIVDSPPTFYSFFDFKVSVLNAGEVKQILPDIFAPLSEDDNYFLLARHMPKGKAWHQVFNENSNIGKLIKCLSKEFFRLQWDIKQVIDETDLRNLNLLLSEFETSVGIPDETFLRGDF